jgi:hypothetical protein
MPLSPTRCSGKRTTHDWETSVKNDRISASSMKFTFLLLIPDDQRVQRFMLAAFGSKAIREPEEIFFVDRAQHFGSGSLDNFVFERGDRERASAAVFLRNMVPRLSDAGMRCPAASQTRDLPVPVQRASAHARFFDHAGPSERSK